MKYLALAIMLNGCATCSPGLTPLMPKQDISKLDGAVVTVHCKALTWL